MKPPLALRDARMACCSRIISSFQASSWSAPPSSLSCVWRGECGGDAVRGATATGARGGRGGGGVAWRDGDGTRARDHQIIQEAAHDYSSSHRRRRQEGRAAAEERERDEGFGWHGAGAVMLRARGRGA